MSGWEGDAKKCFTSQCGGNPEEAMTMVRRRRRRRSVQTGGRATSTRRLLGRWWQGSGMARKVGFQLYFLTFLTSKINGNYSLAKMLSSVDLGYMENPCSMDIFIYGMYVYFHITFFVQVNHSYMWRGMLFQYLETQSMFAGTSPGNNQIIPAPA